MIKSLAKIEQFMQAGGQITRRSRVDNLLEQDSILNYVERMWDEARETEEAANLDNIYDGLSDSVNDEAELVDGFLDTAYVAFTGAIRVVGLEKTLECWNAIVQANDNKINGRFGDIIVDPDTGKILKPEGWQAPDIEKIINA